MTRKDFDLIADALNTAFVCATSAEQRRGVMKAIHNTATTLRSTNPRFDFDRFIAAATELNGL
jgi:hypothetical protein